MTRWGEKAKRNANLIVRQSIQDVSEIAQSPKAQGGRMPVDTGFLRNSYNAGIDGATTATGPAAYVAAVAGLEVGDTFNARWSAGYAMRMEKGFAGADALGRTYSQPGNFFMENALMQWSAIVEANARKVSES